MLLGMEGKASVKKRGDALYDHILDTALNLFSDSGYFGTSIHDIHRAAGVSVGAIYHHFKNKEALAKSLYDLLLKRMETAIIAACAGETGCRARSRAVIVGLFELTLPTWAH